MTCHFYCTIYLVTASQTIIQGEKNMNTIENFSITSENDESIENRFMHFVKSNKINQELHKSKIFKSKGVSPIKILTALLFLPFYGQNIYRAIVNKENSEIKKTATYDFLSSPKYSWRRLYLSITSKISIFIYSLTSEKVSKVLIFDDTSIKRNRSKKVELLSRCYDHNEKVYYKGHRNLALVWSDGKTTIPLDFALLSSENEKNRYVGITNDVDKRSCGYKRRVEAITKSTELLEPMLKRALNSGVKADFLLFDSWFGSPIVIKKLRQHIDIICRLKDVPTWTYKYNGKDETLKGIYRKLKKRPGKSKYLSSTIVEDSDGNKSKLVFVRAYKSGKWIALLSTNINLSEEEIITAYSKRWNVEVFFRTAKQHLQLEKGTQARNFDNLIAHTTIAYLRYVFLSTEQRYKDDPRSLGLLFHACCEEIREVSYLEAFKKVGASLILEMKSKIDDDSGLFQELFNKLFQAAKEVFSHKLQLNDECQGDTS